MKKITSKKKLLLYGCSGMGVNMLTLMIGSYLCSALLVGGFDEHIESWTYLNKDLVVAGLWAVLVFFAKALDGLIDLPFSTLADKMHSKLGRRKTALLIGFIPMIVAYLLFLVPLNTSATILNTVWFGVLLCVFYSFYTLTMLTFYATFSEVCDSEQDMVFLSNVKSVCDVVYFILGFALIPVFVGMGVNIRIIALIFLPLSLTMMIPFFLLKENSEDKGEVRSLTLKTALSTSFKNKPFIIWMVAMFMMKIGLELFLGGINELFSSTGLDMTIVMASSFVPVPFTLILYNYIVKRKGLGFAFRYILSIFSVGMIIMFVCTKLSDSLSPFKLTLIAIFGGILVSFAIGAFFSVTYTVPSHIAQRENETSGKSIASMIFAVQGLFEGIASGIATGFILVTLKDFQMISILPLIVALCCMMAFGFSFVFPKTIAFMGKDKEKGKE